MPAGSTRSRRWSANKSRADRRLAGAVGALPSVSFTQGGSAIMNLRTRLAWAACLLIACGCIPESQQPLSDPATAQRDDRLIGLWEQTLPNGDRQYYHVGAEPEKPLDPTAGQVEPGLMRFWLIGHNFSTKQVTKPFGMRFFVSHIGSDDYLNLVLPLDDPAESPSQPARAQTHTYWLLRYRVSGDQLELWGIPLDVAAAEVDSGRLAGEVVREDGKVQSVTFREPTEKLVAYLQGGGNRTLFPDSSRSVYRRVR